MIIILLGSNIGDRLSILEEANLQISSKIGNPLISSSIFESEPWGFKHENYFLNQVIGLKTNLSPYMLLTELLRIEKKMGRERSKKKSYQARTIDLDILFFNDLIISESNLEVPHPRLHERRFTLLPLNEILPDYIHPVFKKPVSSLLNDCNDTLMVNKL